MLDYELDREASRYGFTHDPADILTAMDMATEMDSAGLSPGDEVLDQLVKNIHDHLKANKPGCTTNDEAITMVLGGRLTGEDFWGPSHEALRARFIGRYGEEGERLLDEVEQALGQCHHRFFLQSTVSRENRDLEKATYADVVIPGGDPPDIFATLMWRASAGVAEVRLYTGPMFVTYRDFYMKGKGQDETCEGDINTLKGSWLSMTFKPSFREVGGIESFLLTDYAIAGRQSQGTMACKDSQGGETKTPVWTPEGYGDMWASLFFTKHPRLEDFVLKATDSGSYSNWFEGWATDMVGLKSWDDSIISIEHKPLP